MLSVVYGRTTPIYKPGEQVLGDVVICVASRCNILDLTVNYVGLSSVGFVVSQGKSRSLSCNKVAETDTHLDVLHPLVKSYRGVEIGPGVHTYSFAYCLPDLLPSSYNSPYGRISYYLQVHLQTSAATQDIRSHFFVRAAVNINLFKSSLCPKKAEVTENYGIFGTKTFQLKICLSKTCFVPGDIISVLVEVDNATSRHLRYLFCTLKQITQVLVQLHDQTENRTTKQNLVTIGHKVAGNQACYSWHCQFRSPTFLTPTISASTIVFVTYVIQVSAKLTRVTVPPQVQIPVVFGVRAPVLTNDPAPTSTNLSSHRSSLQDGIFSENIQPHQSNPTVTNPRRRVTVCNQPKYSLLDSGSQKVVKNYQRQHNDPADDLEEEDLVSSVENVGNGNARLNFRPTKQRRRFTICTQPNLHAIVITQQESQEDIYGPTQPNYVSELCIDADTSVKVSLISDLRHRLSFCNVIDSSFPYSVLEDCQQDSEIPMLLDIKNGFKADYEHVPSEKLQLQKQSVNSKNKLSNSSKQVGHQLQTIASQVSQRFSNQWQSNYLNQFRQFDCEHM